MSVVKKSWQFTKLSIKERSKFIFNNDLFSDVKFVVRTTDGGSERKQVIPAHKLVLSISSPVFEAMFYGELVETKDSIELPDCEYESLLEFFRFMYSDEVNLSGINVMGVLYLAKKYMVPSVANKCAEYLLQNLDPSNVFGILPSAQKYEEKDLVERCWKVIDENTEQAAESEGFFAIERSLLESVVTRDTLTIEEINLFKAVDSWATRECGRQGLEADGLTKRRVLGEEIVKAIRFPVMNQKDFAKTVLDSDILNPDEVKKLIKYLNSALCVPVGFPEKIRSSVPRACGEIHRCFRFLRGRNLFPDQLEANGSRVVEVSVDRKILLQGVCLCGGGKDNPVELSLWNNQSQLAHLSGKFSSNNFEDTNFGGYHTYQILFDKEIVLRGNTTYRIEARVGHPVSWCGEGVISSVTCSGIKFTFQSIAGKDFPTLLFSKLL
ncbi:BTB/POZ domain-containing protein 6-like [Stylophora pistillata]|nr:BTB/POZ domain-containing protein 6-like [Stylophora pistillata]